MNKLLFLFTLGVLSSSAVAAESYVEVGYQKQSLEYTRRSTKLELDGVRLAGHLAFDTGWFVGMDMYQSKDKEKDQNSIEWGSYTHSLTSESEESLVQYKANAGYSFELSESSSLEFALGYGHFRQELDYKTYYTKRDNTDPESELIYLDVERGEIQLSKNFIDLSTVFSYRFNDVMSVDLGAEIRQQEIFLEDTRREEIALMAGLVFEFDNNLGARLSYKKFNNFVGAHKMDIASLSVRYRF